METQTSNPKPETAAGDLWAIPEQKEKYLVSLANSFMSEVVNDPCITAERKEHYQRMYYLFTVVSYVKTEGEAVAG